MNTGKKCLNFALLLFLIFVLMSCVDHGRFVATVQPVCLKYDKYLLQWTSITALFYYDIYEKEGSYIAVYKINGEADDDNEIKVIENIFYNRNHPTSEYQYCVDDYYFNFHDYLK